MFLVNVELGPFTGKKSNAKTGSLGVNFGRVNCRQTKKIFALLSLAVGKNKNECVIGLGVDSMWLWINFSG